MSPPDIEQDREAAADPSDPSQPIPVPTQEIRALHLYDCQKSSATYAEPCDGCPGGCLRNHAEAQPRGDDELRRWVRGPHPAEAQPDEPSETEVEAGARALMRDTLWRDDSLYNAETAVRSVLTTARSTREADDA